jgi:pimeloyl-ACP methyl ester carboxylesterase
VRGCQAIVGHSVGGYVAAGVAANPPPELRAAMLIDRGFLDACDFAELGMPTTAGRAPLIRERARPDWMADLLSRPC